MEALPCSGVQDAGESDSSQPNPVTTCVDKGDNNCPENGEQVKLDDDKLNDSLFETGEPLVEKQGQMQQTVCQILTSSDCKHSGNSYCDNQVQDQKESSSLHDIEENGIKKPSLTSENSPSVVDVIERESPNSNGEAELSFTEPTWLERDESLAVWVKWRGKWQTGIKCARADWPLSTLKEKPTHDQKKYFVIFSPHTRAYSWADMLLVRSIDEIPEPIAYKTHQEGLKMVKDLTIARRFTMQKIALGMLDIVDQFHPNALIEAARDVRIWKQFAIEASRCPGYSDLGRTLLKLQNNIVQQYIHADWMLHSSNTWVVQCQNANSAESVERLKEELFNSILWNDVTALGDALAQPKVGSEWKTWKNDVMKWFYTFPSFSSSKDMQQQTSDGLHQVSVQVASKRPKLEIRRADTHTSLVQTKGADHSISLETVPGFFKDQDSLSTLAAETSKQKDVREVAVVATDSPRNLTNNWNEIVVEPADSETLYRNGMESTPVNEMAEQKSVEPDTKFRQCSAYIEAKGRQCVRWAIGGDTYCCVHTPSRYSGSSGKAEKPVPVETPICGGTTIAGTRCKHHSIPGSSFCKKHETSNLARSTPKRKLEENYTGSNTKGLVCKDMVLVNDESPLQVVDPVSAIGCDSFLSGNDHNSVERLHCIGSPHVGNEDPCLEGPKWYSLYCEKHLPSWLKNARNGKSRVLTKEVFTKILRDCCSLEQKVHLHKACAIFYRLFKSILSLKNPESKEVQFQRALTEASKDTSVGAYFNKLVHSEKERLKLIWGFNGDIDTSSLMEGPSFLPTTITDSVSNENAIKCKICNEEFPDDQALGSHWMDNHYKEAQWLFRGYACAICLDSFTNKKLLETHVQERHHVKFVEQCLLLQCIPCGSHFGNVEELWSHVLSVHPVEFKPSKAPEQRTLSISGDSPKRIEQGNEAPLDSNSEKPGGFRRFICRFCGLRFNLLPDLGRHHQAAHMERNLVSRRSAKRGVRHYAHRLKSGRLSHPKFKKSLAAVSHRIKRRPNANLKRRVQETRSLDIVETTIQPHVNETEIIGELEEHQCSAVAKILVSEVQKTKPRPNNLDILSIARSSCCKVNLNASLEEKYGTLPERLYLKAAKLCSEHNILVNWHQEGFICPRGCKAFEDQRLISSLASLSNGFMKPKSLNISDPASDELEQDEFHYIINSRHLKSGSLQKAVVLCDDISFGKELMPVSCVVDQEILNSLLSHGSNEQDISLSKPWESFTYVTKPMLDQSPSLSSESLQLRCSCPFSTCCPETCDHVYLFDNDYDDAKDIFGKPMHGRFPYDENGRIILEEGYLVYECNHMCGCNKTCPNRILQNGIRVKLEVFKTEKKGWGLRAGEAIMRGTFVCEYIGEVLEEQEAHNRCRRYGKEHCSYFYNIDAKVNDMSRLIGGQARYVIDATRYANVSRFINSSCSPNLVNYQVLVESMDCEHAHIGLYASRDIALGEELTYNYQYELVPGEGSPCLCGSSKCRGRLY